jgi:RNA recognition motif-containing protein
MQIYIGNLPENYTDAELRALFEPFGKVAAASIGKEKGYGFVEMKVKSEGRTAIESLRGKEMAGKPLRVRALKPGDEFHDHARTLQAKPGSTAFNAGKQFRGAGAIRRGGQRGS